MEVGARQRTLPVCTDGENWEDASVRPTSVGDQNELEVSYHGERLVACAGMDVVLDDGAAACIVLCGGERPLPQASSSSSSKSGPTCVRLPFPLDATMPRLPWCASLLRDDGHHDLSTSALKQILMQTPRVPLSPRRRLRALDRSRELCTHSGTLALASSRHSMRRSRIHKPALAQAQECQGEEADEDALDQDEGELSDAQQHQHASEDSADSVDDEEDADTDMSCDEEDDSDVDDIDEENADDNPEAAAALGWATRPRRGGAKQ